MLSASSYYVHKAKGKQAKLYIDLKPALTEEQLDQRILRDFSQSMNKQLKNVLGALLPSKMVPVMIKVCGLDGDKQINEVTKEERHCLLQNIKIFTITLTGLRSFNEAIITQGGVSVKDVKAGTMESKKVSGLYFAGEVLDVDALTGGYNLQVAWSTGYLAGSNIW